ncbi:Deoxyribodipyrimidine photo-lyase type II [Chlorobium phaeobacteroides DSM 266]|uniref:Deoxyribodipyrimidine photo-lyase n=2 Tax=Chlorobium phaeobacteroides TaxID=1096 RepID=A1BHU7_CHLPD|nr:Deoxyribodipyrimidine photo-lyase type II [Chlorobium phaeobacteroides DSM 266]
MSEHRLTQKQNALMIDPRRTRVLNSCSDKPGAVIYWMSRDQRLNHNWALLFAREKAARKGQPLVVVFALAPSFLDAPFRHYDFMLKGLEETSKALERINIPFMLLEGEPDTEISRYACQSEAGAVVTDFSPLNISRNWKKKAADILDIPLYEVDAHNIVPCWYASDKQEYAARTLRPKLQARLDEFLVPFPTILPLPAPHVHHRSPDWKQVRERLQKDRSVPPVNRIAPGETAAAESLENFIKSRLSGYATARNDPNSNALSQLSPYLHFGQISAQHVALRVAESRAPQKDKTAFLEELIIRRELSDNFCNYNPSYDRFEGIPAWAKQTLLLHGQDKREYLYTIDVFEKAATHDKLWNAAQSELVQSGKIHGYMRMYWAKKILEWSSSPPEAFEMAIYLNDRYALDGRDPNGYAGVAWSIGGLHDRPWFERPVYGNIRYMNASGCRRKFDVERYISRFREPATLFPNA